MHVRLRGHDLTARPELVSDVDQIENLLGALVANNPRSASFIRIPRDTAGHFDLDELQNAVRHGFRIVRWQPADTKSAQMMAQRTSIEPATPQI